MRIATILLQGQSYNAAYRKYKNITRTSLDNVFKGRYSNNPTNLHGVTDSAAGATCFASRVVTHNGFIGVDSSGIIFGDFHLFTFRSSLLYMFCEGNPKGSILAAAKRQGKGTGIVVTKSVTDATPAAFSAHSLYRNWHQMIAKQVWWQPISSQIVLGDCSPSHHSTASFDPNRWCSVIRYTIRWWEAAF